MVGFKSTSVVLEVFKVVYFSQVVKNIDPSSKKNKNLRTLRFFIDKQLKR